MQFLPSLGSSPISTVPRLLLSLVIFGALAVSPARADVPVVPLEPAETLPVPSDDRGHTPPEVILTPDGGYLAVWVDIEADRVIGRRFGPPDDAGASESEGFALSSEGATSFGPVVTDAFEPPLFEPFGLAARPGGGYVLAWGEEGVDGWEIWYRFLGPLGQPLASSLVADIPSGTEGSQPQVAVGSDGTFVVTWRSWQGSDDPGRLQARVFTGSGQPAGQPFELLPGSWARVWHDLAATGAGKFLLAWAGGGAPGIPARSLLVRSFHADGTLGSPVRLDVGDDPDRVVATPALAAVPGRGAVAAWAEGTFDPTVPKGRLIDGGGNPRSEPFDLLDGSLEGDYVNGVRVHRDAEGRLVFGWGEAIQSHFIPTDEQLNWTGRARRFTEDPAEPPPPPPPPPPPSPPPPDAPPLTTDAVPGFRFWVEITDPAGEAVLGTAVGPCIPETLCVAGRLPDRHEVFVRIVGPKPNGRLWPTLVKFTTSQVEVWIEQAATGELEYYLLEGARPGFDQLPGLFDREGFEP